MKTIRSIFIPLILLLIGCAGEQAPTEIETRTFSGITERDEWGNIISEDTTDWVIDQFILPGTSSNRVTLPVFRNDRQITGSEVSMSLDDLEYYIGVFPNPFIPGTGRINFEFTLPVGGAVTIHLENESGSLNFLIYNNDAASMGVYTITWEGADNTGALLPNGIYRIYFEAGLASSFGDLQVIHMGYPEPPGTATYVLYADSYYDSSSYLLWEYETAVNFGSDGLLGTNDEYLGTFGSWTALDYTYKFNYYLPIFMNYDLFSADQHQFYYLIAYKHFQFGAGWPDNSYYGVAYDSIAYWQLESYVHDTYLDLYGGGQ